MEVVQLIVNGLMAGTILAVPAIGLTAIFAVLRFPNFALASHMTIGAFAGFVANVTFGLPIVASLVIAFVVAGARRVGHRRAGPQAVPGRGLHHHRHRLDRAHHRARELRALRLRQRAARLRSADPARLASRAACASGRSRCRTSLSRPSPWRLLFAFLSFTRTGKAMRAVADNPMLADIKGINADMVARLVSSSAWGWPGSAAC